MMRRSLVATLTTARIPWSRIRPEGDRLFRTGAGHIHIGWGADIPVDNREHHEICASFVKMLDATVGLFMTCIDRDPRRRELYGKALPSH